MLEGAGVGGGKFLEDSGREFCVVFKVVTSIVVSLLSLVVEPVFRFFHGPLTGVICSPSGQCLHQLRCRIGRLNLLNSQLLLLASA